MSYEFINKEFIHFSKYDCDRSIPNLMDGLKISLRKILFASFKKNLTSEIKVSTLQLIPDQKLAKSSNELQLLEFQAIANLLLEFSSKK